MAKIYAEMFLCDQRISLDKELERTADTTLVYDAVLAEYGYSAEDYNASQEYYLRDARRYTRILKKSVSILEKQSRVLKGEKSMMDALLLAETGILHFAPHRVFLLDTLSAGVPLLCFDFQEGMDTVFQGPRILVAADSVLALADTLAAVEDVRDSAYVDAGPEVTGIRDGGSADAVPASRAAIRESLLQRRDSLAALRRSHDSLKAKKPF